MPASGIAGLDRAAVSGSRRLPRPPASTSANGQAQASKAKIVALANAVNDTVNSVKQATEFGIQAGGQELAALLMQLSDVHAIGLKDAQGLYLTEGFYWDANPGTRAFADRFGVALGRADLVVVTSGSTGGGRGVLLPAGALQASAAATLDRIGGPGSWLLALPVSAIAGLQVVCRALLSGRSPVRLTGTLAEAVARMPAGDRRYTSMVPTQLRRWLDTEPDALRAFDAILVGGAATDPALLDRARAEGVAVVTTYGMTETAGGCVYDGLPLDGVAVRIAEGGIELAGGTVEHLGMPVDPGNLLLVGARGDVPVVGAPGCARSPQGSAVLPLRATPGPTP